MKNVLFFFLFSLSVTAQSVTYQRNNVVISNPEKGFYHYTDTGSGSTYNLLSTQTISNFRTNENITVIYRYFYLTPFINGQPISASYLANMQTDFNRVRSAGAKVIVRFAYTSNSTTVYQPTKAQILAQISQVAPIVNANKDVVVSVQAGWIGRWGEWYYTGSTEFGEQDNITQAQWNNRKEVVDAMINGFDPIIPLQVRYVGAKQKMYGNTYVGRIGFYNDSFLGTWGDSGTFTVNSAQGQPSAAEVTYWQTQTINLPVTGESNMFNKKNPERQKCPNAMLELNKFNWSIINKDYFPKVISGWISNGCYPTIQKSIGYDFALNNSTITNGNLTVNIGNYGYANLFKDRKAYLVCKNTTTNVNYSFVIDENLKNCRTTNYNLTANLNVLVLPSGTYKLYLNLPDSLIANPLYSIQMSNVGTWTSEGFNDLLLTFNVAGLRISNNQLSLDSEKISHISIYDFSGNLVSENLDVSNLPKGIYIVITKTESGKTIKDKIIL